MTSRPRFREVRASIREVWSYTPRPTPGGVFKLRQAVEKWTDPTDQNIADAMAKDLNDNI